MLNEVRKEEIGPSFGYIFHKPSSLLHEIVDKGDKIEVAKFWQWKEMTHFIQDSVEYVVKEFRMLELHVYWTSTYEDLCYSWDTIFQH